MSKPPMIQLLSALWPEPPEDGYLSLWELPDKESFHYPIRDILKAGEADVEELLETFDGHNLYFGLGLRCAGLDINSRGTKKHVNYLPGFALDIDLFNPDNPNAHKAKGELPKNDQDVDAILGDAPPPTAVVHTGHGYHFYWAAPKMMVLTCKAQRDAAHNQYEAWQQTFIDRAKELGFHLDKTATIDRVWRLPGSRNCKKKES